MVKHRNQSLTCKNDKTKIFANTMLYVTIYFTMDKICTVITSKKNLLINLKHVLFTLCHCWCCLASSNASFEINIILLLSSIQYRYMACFVDFTKFFRLSMHVPLYAVESDMNVKNWSYPTRNAVVDFTKFFGK